MTTTPAYRLSPGLIVLLAIISVANALVLVIAIGPLSFVPLVLAGLLWALAR